MIKGSEAVRLEAAGARLFVGVPNPKQGAIDTHRSTDLRLVQLVEVAL